MKRRQQTVVISLAFIALVLVGAMGCGGGDPETAGNRTAWLLGDLVGKKYPDAYSQLCAEVRQRVSLDQFTASEGRVVSPLFIKQTWRLSEGHEKMPSINTASEDVTETWLEVDTSDGPRFAVGETLVATQFNERWRIDLVREDGKWRPCSFRQV